MEKIPVLLLSVDNKLLYETARREANKELKATKRGYENHLSENIKTNNKAFWKYVQSRTKTRESVGNLVDENGETLTDGLQKTKMLNIFISVFTRENTTVIPPFDNRCEGTTLENFDITVELIESY